MLIAIFAVMAYGLDIIVSDLGEVSLAHTVFFAAGSYTTALLATRGGVGSSWLTLAGSIAMALLLAGAIGLVTLRLREFVFSLVTYAVAVVAMTVAANWAFMGGSDGVRGIPTLDLSLPGLTLTAQGRPHAVARMPSACWWPRCTWSTASAIRPWARRR